LLPEELFPERLAHTVTAKLPRVNSHPSPCRRQTHRLAAGLPSVPATIDDQDFRSLTNLLP
jgi:hypothetical protein